MTIPNTHIVVVGGGIIGLGAAFCLATDPTHGSSSTITIIDNAPSLLQSCSGAANGGNGPGDGDEPLCELNASLLTKLKEEYNGFDKWCHRPCQTVKVVRREDNKLGNNDMPTWLSGLNHTFQSVRLGEPFEHIFPRRFCEFLIQRCQEAGVTIITNAEVVDALTNNSDNNDSTTINAVRVQKGGDSTEITTIECQKLLLTAGAWTPQLLRRLFPTTSLDIHLAPGPPSLHWLNVRDPNWTPGQVNESATQVLFEEVFGFPLNLTNYSNGIIYVGTRFTENNPVGDPGFLQPPKGEEGLPQDVAHVEPILDNIATLLKWAAKALGLKSDDELDVIRHGRAFYSVPTCRRPISAQISKNLLGWGDNNTSSGVFVSFGHDSGCSYSLGNGKVLSEMILGKVLSHDMNEFAIPEEYIK